MNLSKDRKAFENFKNFQINEKPNQRGDRDVVAKTVEALSTGEIPQKTGVAYAMASLDNAIKKISP